MTDRALHLQSIRGSGRLTLWLVACLLSTVSVVRGHAESLSGLQVTLRDDGTRVTLSLPMRELSRWFVPSKYPDYGPQVAAEMERADLVQIQYGEATAPRPAAVRARVEGDASIVVESDFPPMNRDEGALAVWSTAIGNLPNDHKQFLTVEDQRAGVNRVVAQETLTAIQDAWSGTLPNLPPAPASQPAAPEPRRVSPAERAAHVASEPSRGAAGVTSFFLLGVEHILTGYDHLLFLAALLLVCDRFRDAARIVTVFTVAHSVTLALAALDIVRLPGRVVEPLIAASIVYVAFENIVLRGKPQPWRRVVVFGFGLIHGLGFAAALREVGLGSAGAAIALPLVKFSIGVEAERLSVTAVALPVIFWLKRRPSFATRGVSIASASIAAFGLFWFVERIVSAG